MGQQVADYLTAHPHLGRYWLREVIEDGLHLKYTDEQRQRVRRAYDFWLDNGAGRYTSAGAGVDSRTRLRSRTDGDRCRTRATDIIDYELLQWFVDNILGLDLRGNATALLKEARRIADTLVASGTPRGDIGVIDKHWMRRWRRRHGISMHACHHNTF